MNERIKELAVQAGFTGWTQQTTIGLELEKFAELIVKECAKVADDGFASSNFGNGITGHQLLKHFGVEE
jgi:3-deoxy-D-manno-octulosonate 8-phosphate phosphatase KdsC-like HAD superfamily phosphatase